MQEKIRGQRYVAKPEDIATYDANPFLPDLVANAAGKVKSRQSGTVMHAKNGFVSQRLGVHDLKTGEILADETLVVAVRKAVDTEEFTKIFTGSVAGLLDLSRRAVEVFAILIRCYNAKQLQGSNDLIFFNHHLAVEHGYTRSVQTLRSAMNELMHHKFLVPASMALGWYWINPTLFYRGDRITLINQYVLNEQASKKGDAVLDQQDLFSGLTPREEMSE